MGPGTHIVNKINKRVLPTSYNDALALKHDLQYLAANNKSQLNVSDDLAITAADYSVQGITMKLGLTLRKVLSINKLGNRPKLAQALYNIVRNDPDYVNKYNQLGISLPENLWDA